jgi:hypothetical protein
MKLTYSNTSLTHMQAANIKYLCQLSQSKHIFQYYLCLISEKLINMQKCA